jgi:hypothetical protein
LTKITLSGYQILLNACELVEKFSTFEKLHDKEVFMKKIYLTLLLLILVGMQQMQAQVLVLL